MARRSVRLLASIAAVATMVTTFAACGNKQATTDENGKPIVNILVRRNVTDHPMQDTQYTKDLEAACDCTIKWQEVSDNAWGQQKSAKMAAGEFPDIGLSLFSMVDAAKYSTYFEDLKPHLDKMPNVKKFLKAQPGAAKYVTDGTKIAMLPSDRGKGYEVPALTCSSTRPGWTSWDSRCRPLGTSSRTCSMHSRLRIRTATARLMRCR